MQLEVQQLGGAGAGHAPEDPGAPNAGRDASRLRLRLLGGFALNRGEKRLDVPLAAQRVLAFLAVQKRSVDRVAVSGALWLESSEEHASASLRTALWRLRQIAGEAVRANGSTVELSKRVAVDIAPASARVEILSLHPEEYCARDLDLLGAAGELLPDWYDEWVLIERERFRQLRLHVLESLCRGLSASGAHAEAVRAGLAAIALEPLRESSHRALMSAYLAEGNPTEALRHYEIYRHHLLGALGIKPSPRMDMLIARLGGA